MLGDIVGLLRSKTTITNIMKMSINRQKIMKTKTANRKAGLPQQLRFSGKSVAVLISFILSALLFNTAQAELVRYLDDTGVEAAPNFVGPDLTASDFILSSTGLEGFSTWGSKRSVFIRTRGTADSEAAAIEAGDFFAFTVTPKEGEQLDLGSLSFELGVSGLSPNAFAFVRSSLDSFENTIGTSPILAPGSPTASAEWASTMITPTISLPEDFQGLESPVTFRIYLYDDLDTWDDMLRLSNVQLWSSKVDAIGIDGDGPDMDFTFGTVYLPNAATDNASRTVGFTNIAEEEIVVTSISLPEDANGAFQIGAAPEVPFTLSSEGVFDVEVLLGASFIGQALEGLLVIDSDLSADRTPRPFEMDLTGTAYTEGDTFPLNNNPSLDFDLSQWTTASGPVHVVPGFDGSSRKARLRGRNDGGEPNSFGQSNIPAGLGDFEVKFFLAIPEFGTAVGASPDPTMADRSFQFVLHSDDNIPRGANGIWNDNHASSALVNLAYLPAGNGSTGEGFYVFDGSSWEILSSLGTIERSVDADGSGGLDSTAGDTVNVYQLTLTGRDFGTQAAVYDVVLSEANSTSIAAIASDLTVSHATEITEHTPGGYTFTTGDRSTDSGGGEFDFAWSSSFWIDEISISIPGGLPFALHSANSVTFRAMADRPAAASVSLTNFGLGMDLEVWAVDFSETYFDMPSGSMPTTIAPGETGDLELVFDPHGLPHEEAVVRAEMVIESNSLSGANVVPVEVLVHAPDNFIFGSFEVPGLDPLAHTDTFAGWREELNPELVINASGLGPGSNTAAFIDGSEISGGDNSRILGSVFEQLGNFELTMYFAIQPTSSAGSRQFSLILHSEEGARMNMRFQDGVWSAVDGGWQPFLETDLALSIDADGDGDLDGPSDVKEVYQLKISGRNWETQEGEYDVSVYDVEGNLLGIATDLQYFQHARANPRLNAVEFTSQWDLSPGFWVDDIVLTTTETTAPMEFRVNYVSFKPEVNPNTTLRWTDIGGEYVILASDELPFGATKVTEIPVNPENGTLDETTFPGEVEFSFHDEGASGVKRFWKVRQFQP